MLNMATPPALYAADYASHEYGAANTADAPTAAPAARAPVRAARHHPIRIGDTPQRGETMRHVRARYGAPLSRRGPVGRPPITRWNYAGYHVYFEGNRVIHTVVPADPEPVDHVRQLENDTP
ncbi:hypothetical protein C41B8_12634 [Salinisphaera hydrothermalis C41B8]|uniref:Uncharacterized protein n=2 Tax=Salinisphaera TaxID=180541 RepID=A0A084IJN6_SALHC|nr:hypothetical protein C41B8_12634 [Salinisphaera hydrothermalis C41B8]